MFNVINRKDPDKGVQIWDMSYFLFGKVLDARLRNSEDDDGWDKFFFLEGGLMLKVGFEEETFGGHAFCKTETIDFKSREDYDEDILKEVHCLDEIVEVLEYDKLKKMFLEAREEKDDDEDDEEKPRGKKRESDDDEDEKPSKHRKEDADDDEDEPKAKKKPAPDDDEDDWGDFEDKKSKKKDDDEDEPDDDEEPPKKKKRKDDDEDEPDEDEDEAPKKKSRFAKQKGDRGWDDIEDEEDEPKSKKKRKDDDE